MIIPYSALVNLLDTHGSAYKLGVDAKQSLVITFDSYDGMKTSRTEIFDAGDDLNIEIEFSHENDQCVMLIDISS